MEEAEKTREQLLCELMALRQRIAPLEVTSTMRQEVAAQGIPGAREAAQWHLPQRSYRRLEQRLDRNAWVYRISPL
jgi:hypothetical protein